MKKVVLKLDIPDDRVKQKAMKNVSSLPGVDSIAMDMKDKKFTVTGDVDPVTVVSKLRKICHADIISVGPAKEPEKKKEEGGGDKKKEEEKKKAEEKKKEEEKRIEALRAYYNQLQQQQQLQQYPYYNQLQQQQQQQQYPYYNYQQQSQPYYHYNQAPTPSYYSKVVHDETPNCVIC